MFVWLKETKIGEMTQKRAICESNQLCARVIFIKCIFYSKKRIIAWLHLQWPRTTRKNAIRISQWKWNICKYQMHSNLAQLNVRLLWIKCAFEYFCIMFIDVTCPNTSINVLYSAKRSSNCLSPRFSLWSLGIVGREVGFY